jgi:hypothetical protein
VEELSLSGFDLGCIANESLIAGTGGTDGF